MATPAHCYYCFDVLDSHLENRAALTLSRIEAHLSSNPLATNGNGTAGSYSAAASTPPEKTPLFITWKKRHGDEYDLRGCIGTFYAQPLEEGLCDYALTA